MPEKLWPASVNDPFDTDDPLLYDVIVILENEFILNKVIPNDNNNFFFIFLSFLIQNFLLIFH